MLVKALSRQNIGLETAEAAADAAQRALDGLWKEGWITASVTHRDERAAAELRAWAEDIRRRTGLVVISAGRGTAALRAILDACPGSEGSPEVIVWDGSLSPGDFSALIKKIDNVNTVLIAVSSGEETLEQRAAYAVIKQAVFAAHHAEEGEKVFAICPRGAGEIGMDAEENSYPRADLDPGDDEWPGNSAAALLGLMIKGADAGAYLKGFYDTVSSPEWDTGAALTSYVLAEAAGQAGGKGPDVISWQRELRGFARWFAEKAGGTPLYIPRDKGRASSVPRIMIFSEQGHQDIMTPPFEGCDPDGSLELLLGSAADSWFFGTSEEDGLAGFKFCVEELDERNAGALAAYIQMTLWLAEYFGNAGSVG